MSNPWETKNRWGKGSEAWNRWMGGNPWEGRSREDSLSRMAPPDIDSGVDQLGGRTISEIIRDTDFDGCEDLLQNFRGWEDVETDRYIAVDYGAYQLGDKFQRANVVSETIIDVRWEHSEKIEGPHADFTQWGSRTMYIFTREVFIDLNGLVVDERETSIFLVIDAQMAIKKADKATGRAHGKARSAEFDLAVRLAVDYIDPRSGHAIPSPVYLQWQKTKLLKAGVQNIGFFLLEEVVIAELPLVRDVYPFIKLMFDLGSANIWEDDQAFKSARIIVLSGRFSATKPIAPNAAWVINRTDSDVLNQHIFSNEFSAPCWVPVIPFPD